MTFHPQSVALLCYCSAVVVIRFRFRASFGALGKALTGLQFRHAMILSAYCPRFCVQIGRTAVRGVDWGCSGPISWEGVTVWRGLLTPRLRHSVANLCIAPAESERTTIFWAVGSSGPGR